MWDGLAVSRLQKHAKRSKTRSDSVTEKLDDFLAQQSGKTPDDNARRRWAKDALEATRKRAEGWRNGAAVTLGLAIGALAIKPGEGLMKFGGGTRCALMVLVGLSILAALNSIYRLLRAANGPAWLLELPDDAPAHRWIRTTAGARLDLQVGQYLWIASVVLFSAAVAVTWVQT